MIAKEIKSALLEKCSQVVEERYEKIKVVLADIRESLIEESKSSAGDKHETGRAMLQIERENIGKQLLETENLRQSLHKINIDSPSSRVHLGSLVYTTQGIFFISISAGVINIDSTTYLAISPSSPIGHLLMGKEEGDQFKFHDLDYKLSQVY